MVAAFAPLGACAQGKFVLSSPRGAMGQEEVCWLPLAAVCHVGSVGSVFGENSILSRNAWYKTRGGRHVAKRSSDPR